LGKLVAWSSDESLLESNDIKHVLTSESVTRIALANPKIAPYGLAAQQALTKLRIWEALRANIIRGENVSQIYHFVMTENAQVGFIAKSQIYGNANREDTNKSNFKGSYWEVPEDLYAPIRQQAVLLLRSQHKTAANEFIDFLKSDRAKNILIKQFGYGIETLPGNSEWNPAHSIRNRTGYSVYR
jgi:molybdate transport system substrate-binding protein